MALTFRYEPPKIDPGFAVHARVASAELAAAKALLTAALPEVPFDTGELYASGDFGRDEAGGYVTFTAVNPDDGYDYAAKQHEDEDLNHEHGKVHYLSDPMHQAHAAMLIAAEDAGLRF